MPDLLTVEECREVLGESAKDLTDQQISDLRDSLYGLCETVLNDHYGLE